jgi:hypothetical protein
MRRVRRPSNNLPECELGVSSERYNTELCGIIDQRVSTSLEPSSRKPRLFQPPVIRGEKMSQLKKLRDPWAFPVAGDEETFTT